MSGTRTAVVDRETKESKVHLEVDLDGTGRSDVSTGVGFFDHMLTSFARHALIEELRESANPAPVQWSSFDSRIVQRLSYVLVGDLGLVGHLLQDLEDELGFVVVRGDVAPDDDLRGVVRIAFDQIVKGLSVVGEADVVVWDLIVDPGE